MSKSERIAYITKLLVENPSKVFTLQFFADTLGCAKSTLSEDVNIIDHLYSRMGIGKINSISGASGGVYYSPVFNKKEDNDVAVELCELFKDNRRIIPGGYLYGNDIFYDTDKLLKISKSMATFFQGQEFDYIVTIETKGIPVAISLARLLNKPVVVVRKSARLTEGPTIQMNYLTGSMKAIKTMALPIKSMKRGSKALLVDDFMKAGGTAKGIIDLMKEFDVSVIGVAVVMSTKYPEKKLIKKYYSIVELEEVDEIEQIIKIVPRNNDEIIVP
jgi:purine operon repressor